MSPTPNIANGYPTPGPQTPNPHAVLDSVFFVDDDAWDKLIADERFDYIVIGSSVNAYAFCERILSKHRSARILMLERGPFFLPEHFQNLPIPYVHTLGGLSETYPWTVARKTAEQSDGNVKWLHGSVPFFGGRSIMWSSWCPRPTDEELAGWPPEIVGDAKDHFTEAERLLCVIAADKIDEHKTPDQLEVLVKADRPVYRTLQRTIEQLILKHKDRIRTYTRSMAAPMAVAAGSTAGIDFAKFSTPGLLLDLVDRHGGNAASARLRIATECIVNRIDQQDGVATAIETTRGTVAVRDAKVILSMGALPPATLLVNSFPDTGAGSRFTGHFITAIVARIKRDDFTFPEALADLELAAVYVAGETAKQMQWHVQLSVLSDTKPGASAQRALRYMPDVVATASPEQLRGSEDYLVFVCAVLGELDWDNPDNWFRKNDGDDPTTNMTLQILPNSTDADTWDTMDGATFDLLEKALSPNGATGVEYWWVDEKNQNEGKWKADRPPKTQFRVPGIVHEGSTLWMGDDGPVGQDFRPKGVDNVYVTGGGLWPRSGSFNPTMTMVALTQTLADRFLKGDPEEASPPRSAPDELIASAVE